MIANVEARFASSSPLLTALKIFDPLAVPESSELGFNVYGNREISTLAQHFYQGDDDTSQKTKSSKLLAEWHQINLTSMTTSSPAFPLKSRREKAVPPAHSGF